MPIMSCTTKEGGSGLRWGNKGACYGYEKGNKASMLKAKKQVLKQAAAIGYSKKDPNYIKKELSKGSISKDDILSIIDDPETTIEEIQTFASLIDLDPIEQLSLANKIDQKSK
jgi:hypothetical protein